MFINIGHKLVWTWSCNPVQWTSTELQCYNPEDCELHSYHCKNLTFIMQDQETQELSSNLEQLVTLN